MKRTVIAISAALSLACATAGTATAQGTAMSASDEQVEVAVSIGPVNQVQPNGSTVPDNDAVVATKEFSGTSEQVDKEIEAWKKTVLAEGVEVPSGSGSNTILKKHIVWGDCGWSSIELKDKSNTTYDRQAYMKAEFQLNRPGWSYDVDVLLFSSAPLDFWTDHVPRSGNLLGGTHWSTAGYFTVPEPQDYGATLIEAEVSTETGLCDTAGPRVDEVWVN